MFLENMSSNITSISIIGLGKLGSPMVAAFASKGFKVIGVDKNPEFVRLINEGKPPVFEHRLAEYLDKNKERISATQDFKGAVLNSDITFIIVPTPSEKDGSFSTKYAVEAAEKIGEILREKPDFHLVVLKNKILLYLVLWFYHCRQPPHQPLQSYSEDTSSLGILLCRYGLC